MARKPTDEVQLKLRFQERLRHRLERAAETNKCSMNAEIIRRLEESFQRIDQEKFIKAIVEQTATATVDRFQMTPFSERQSDKAQTELPGPTDSNRKDKAT